MEDAARRWIVPLTVLAAFLSGVGLGAGLQRQEPGANGQPPARLPAALATSAVAKTSFSAEESAAIIDDDRHLTLSEPMPKPPGQKCRVIVLFEDKAEKPVSWPPDFFEKITSQTRRSRGRIRANCHLLHRWTNECFFGCQRVCRHHASARQSDGPFTWLPSWRMFDFIHRGPRTLHRLGAVSVS